MLDIQRQFMLAQADAVHEYIIEAREGGSSLSENEIARIWIALNADEFRRKWFSEH